MNPPPTSLPITSLWGDITIWFLSFNLLMWYITLGEGNGNPLQYSCLENPRDRGACRAAICGVTQSQTQLKQLSSSSSTLIDLQILKNPYIPGIKPTWSWCTIFLICCWIPFAKILLRIFASMFIIVFFFVCCLCLVLVSGWWWPPRMSLEVLRPLQFFERVLEG